MSYQKYIVSHNETLDSYNPQVKRHLLWPCDAYTISLLAKSDEDINQLEKILLTLISHGISELAELTCKVGFDQDLVEFICDKLERLNLIDKRRKITNEGCQLLDKLINEKGALVSATIYYDLINKKFLPVITRGRVSTIVSDNNKFSIGSLGEEKDVTAKALTPVMKKSPTPSPRDIIEIIRCFHKKNKQHGLYLPTASTITVKAKPQRIFLHNQAFISYGDHNIFVTNGFNSNISAEFSEALKLDDFSWLSKVIKDNASTESIDNKSSVNGKTAIERKINKLQEIKDKRDSIKLNTPHAIEGKNDTSLELVKGIYSAIEKIFTELSLRYSTKDWQHCYFSSVGKENGDCAVKIANQLGFVTENIKGLLNVSDRKLHYLYEKNNSLKNADMSSVLAMNLFIASKDNKHLFYTLVKKSPNLLTNISLLRNKRNPLSHGDQQALENISDAEIEQYWEIFLLLKEQVLSQFPMKNIIDNNDNFDWQDSNRRLQANNKLEQEFGSTMLKRLNEDICHNLHRSLVYAKHIDSRICINELTSALQNCFYQASRDLDPLNLSAKKIKQLAEENLGQNFPKSLLKTNDEKVKGSAQGINSTLGAIFISFCARNEESDLSYLSNKCPNIATEIAELIELRGHDGEILDQQENTNKLAASTFCIIKVLAERYCD